MKESVPYLDDWFDTRRFSSARQEYIAGEAFDDYCTEARMANQSLSGIEEMHAEDLTPLTFTSEIFKQRLGPLLERIFQPSQLRK